MSTVPFPKDKTIRTVGELIEALSRLPPDATPVASEPPFVGVRVIAQNNGNVLIAPSQHSE